MGASNRLFFGFIRFFFGLAVAFLLWIASLIASIGSTSDEVTAEDDVTLLVNDEYRNVITVDGLVNVSINQTTSSTYDNGYFLDSASELPPRVWQGTEMAGTLTQFEDGRVVFDVGNVELLLAEDSTNLGCMAMNPALPKP